jgi:hypothetical protein
VLWDLLQRQLVVLPVKVVKLRHGITLSSTTFTYAICRDLPEKARFITENHAMEQLLIMFFSSFRAASSKDQLVFALGSRTCSNRCSIEW